MRIKDIINDSDEEEPRCIQTGYKMKESLYRKLREFSRKSDIKQVSIIEYALLDYFEKNKV